MRRSLAGARPVALALLVLALVLATTPAARAQGSAADPPIRLVAQDGAVAPGGTFTLSVDVPSDDAVDVVVRLHRSVNGRIQFDASVTGERLGSTVHTAPAVPLVDHAATVRIPIDPEQPDGAAIGREGVYPVSVTARDGDGEAVASLTTHLVLLPPITDTSPPLDVAVVVDLGAPPALQPDGTSVIDDPARADLRAAITALDAHPGTALTLRVVPETLRALELSEAEDDRALLDALAEASADRAVLPSTYVRVDTGAWLDEGLHDLLVEQERAGRATLERLLRATLDDGTAIADATTTAAALERLRDAGVRRIVPTDGWLPDDQLPDEGLAGPAPLAGAPEVHVLATDPALRDLLAGDDAVLAAHRTVAALMLRYFELPGAERGEVLLVPPSLAGAPGGLDALLGGVEAATRLRAVSTAQLAAEHPPDDEATPLEARLPAAGGTDGLGDAVAQARADGAAYRSMQTEDLEGELLDELLLVAGSSDLDVDRRAAYLGRGTDLLAQEADGLRVPDRQTVTLTEERADVPLVIENALDHPVQVRLHVRSEKLEFPDGDDRVVELPPGVVRLEVAVRTRATGAFPLEVELRSPTGDVELAAARMSIRSTAISGVGLVLSVGAGLFLALWWARHWRDARRSRRLVSPSHPAVRGEDGADIARQLLEEP